MFDFWELGIRSVGVESSWFGYGKVIRLWEGIVDMSPERIEVDAIGVEEFSDPMTRLANVPDRH